MREVAPFDFVPWEQDCMEGLICYDDKKHFTIPKFHIQNN